MESVLSERKTLHPTTVERRELPHETGTAIRQAAHTICDTLGLRTATSTRIATTLNDPELLRRVAQHANILRPDLAETLRPPATDAGATIISSLPLRDNEIGPTPPDWQHAAAWTGDPDRDAASLELDIALLVLGRCAGLPFGWQGQQNGRLVNNILPALGHENEQSGASSSTLLSPHTEDAFHPHRAGLLLLACLRNHDGVATTVSSVRQTSLQPHHLAQLQRARLPILPDVSYGDAYSEYAPTPLPTLWQSRPDGDTSTLTMRYDPAYTPLADADADYRAAYAELSAELESAAQSVALAAGELLLVDNDVAVHGRVPFIPRYDGTDRWLKRINIRLPQRQRRPAEANENGYGQQTVAPFSTTDDDGNRQDTAHDRGTVEHT